ncbi:serine/arginine repetitive matrix protein 1-like isoform X2 [Stegodyphus dumicola]|uniref:serine/arginine repetitive matrix protein 1-like isoform X2 n=1 Tax=Stegodyphus dumicola TaxID=202533 RepID=UPI0015B136B7|nr:serine/arginine repetitive matrix protein 1-like isoform X2 [Stegodyphus dumicola]
MSFQAEETSVQEDTLYAEQKERATRAKKEVYPNQSTRSRKAKNEGNKKKKRKIFSISTTSSSPAPSTCIPQAEEPFVQEDAQAYAVQKRRATRSRPPEYEHTAPTASLSPPPSPPHHVSSSTMRASRRKRPRLPPRRKPPHRPLTRALTKVQPPVTRTQARQVHRDPDAISDIP